MKFKIISIYLIFALFTSSHQALAQSAKDKKARKEEAKRESIKKKKELKTWKARAKKYSKNPLVLKAFVEAKQESDEQASVALAELKDFKSSVGKKDSKIAELQDKITGANSELFTLKSQVEKMGENPTKPKMDTHKGVMFKVQIGSFNGKDLSKYFDNNPNFAGEVTASGKQRVVIGLFRDYWEADVFKKQLRGMGVRDAWIVPFKDGQRVDIKDVMKGISKEQ